jgi:hypothetical protein
MAPPGHLERVMIGALVRSNRKGPVACGQIEKVDPYRETIDIRWPDGTLSCGVPADEYAWEG